MQIFTYEEMTPSERIIFQIKQFAYTYRPSNRQANYMN